MTVLTPPGYVQGGSYTAKLDRVYNTTTRVVADVSAQLRARQGFYTGRAPVYANPSGWNITMSACGGVVANTFASNSGDYELANDGTVQVTLAASSPTLNRQDIIGFQVKDNLFDASGLNTAVPAVVQGANSAGASADPALPSSFIPVLRAIVPAASSAPTLQTLVRYTTNDGGAIRIDSAAHRAELVSFTGMRIWRSDRGWYETHDGTGWRAWIQRTRPPQWALPHSTTGKLSALPVWMSVSASKSSCRVPKPPGKTMYASEYFTNMVLRTKK